MKICAISIVSWIFSFVKLYFWRTWKKTLTTEKSVWIPKFLYENFTFLEQNSTPFHLLAIVLEEILHHLIVYPCLSHHLRRVSYIQTVGKALGFLNHQQYDFPSHVPRIESFLLASDVHVDVPPFMLHGC